MVKRAIQVKIDDGQFRQAQALLQNMPLKLREKSLVKATKNAGYVVRNRAKQLVPQPGYEGDLPEFKALRDTITTVSRKGRHFAGSITGPVYVPGNKRSITFESGQGGQGEGGNHGHLVEFGHIMVLWGKRTSRFVAPRPFLRPAAEETKAQQRSRMVDVLKRDIQKLAKK